MILVGGNGVVCVCVVCVVYVMCVCMFSKIYKIERDGERRRKIKGEGVRECT